MDGLSGAFFQPLALAYALAMLASMVVALTVTPALCLILLSKAPLSEPRVAAGALAAAVYDAAARARSPPAARGLRDALAVIVAGRRRWCCRSSASRSCPTSRNATS